MNRYAIAWTEFYDNSIEVLLRAGKNEEDVMRNVFEEFFCGPDELDGYGPESDYIKEVNRIRKTGSIDEIEEWFWNADENISDPIFIGVEN